MNEFDVTDVSDEWEECEGCGISDEYVEYREEIGTLGEYLCDACYADALAAI